MPTKPNQISQKRRKVYIFLALIVVLTTALVIKKIYHRVSSEGTVSDAQVSNQESPYEKQLHLLSEEINKGCPMQVDQQTRLDNTEIVGKNEFRYNYTLTSLEKGNFDEADLKQYLSAQILANLKDNEGMRLFREQKTKLSYHYKDRTGQPLFELNFGEGEYN